MSGLTERTVTDLVSIGEGGEIHVRTAMVVERDGIEIARTYHRHIEEPRTDTTGVTDDNVRRIAEVVWTPEVVAAYSAANPE